MTTVLLDNTALLTYSLMTSPTPLEVTPAQGPAAMGALTFVVSAPISIGELTVSSITFNLPVGDPKHPDATDLTDTDGINASVTSSGIDKWQIGPGVVAGSFILRPADGKPIVIAGQALTISFTNITVSPIVGTALVKIIEVSTAPAQPRTLSVAVPKFPAGFYVLDFTPSTPQIGMGQQATLAWVGSSNASYTIYYADTSAEVSKVRTWTSPKLYTTTAFILRASATVNGQTVSLDLTAVVIVAAPDIVTFEAVPDEVDYNQNVVLNWRALNADGVYLLTGQSGRESLPPVSDDTHPKTLQPQYNVQYALQAFKNQPVGGPQLSRVVPLAITFNALDIKSFTATPNVVDLQHQATTLAWEVAHAKGVTYQGGTVPLKGSHVEHPTSNSTYTLVATWVDGTATTKQVPVTVHKVTIKDASAAFAINGGHVIITVKINAEYATAARIENCHMMFNDRHHWYRWGHPQQTGNQSAVGHNTQGTEWQFTLQYDVDQNWLKLPNIGVMIDWIFDGFQPVTTRSHLIMYRGSISFWNGS